MTFAQALARIEELLKERKTTLPGQFVVNVAMTKELLEQHADSIVQLGKAAEGMREDLKERTHPDIKLGSCRMFDKLMDGEE